MKYWNRHFSQYHTLNWMLVWVLMCCCAVLLFPMDRLGIPAANFIRPLTPYFWLGLVISGSYFISQLLLVGWDIICLYLTERSQQSKLEQMIQRLDFSERAVLREFILQRKSVIKLPITEPAVKNLLEAGVLTYAYGQPMYEDDTLIKALMVALPARPYITYRALGISKGKMSEEQIEQIMSSRPKFAGKSANR